MFAYCDNNPVNLDDPTGCLPGLSFLGAIVGGAIGGAVISTMSYVVSSALSGKEITTDGLKSAAVTGAACGAAGAAIGTISLASTVATVVTKGVASVGLGICMGVKAACEAEGSGLKKLAAGVSAGLITAGSTFLGAQIDTSGFGFFGSAFTNFATTLFVGTPAEIAAVASQQVIPATANSAPTKQTHASAPVNTHAYSHNSHSMVMAY